MRISLEENLISLQQAAARLPGRPHISSIWRWYRRGVRGVRLETIVVGGRRYTSSQALERFTEATTAAADGKSTPVRTARSREQAIQRAERELDKAGISDKIKKEPTDG